MSQPRSVKDVLALLEEAVLIAPCDEVSNLKVRAFTKVGGQGPHEGLVLAFANGSRFLVNVVQVRRARWAY